MFPHVRFVLAPEMTQRADHGVGRGEAQPAETGSAQKVRQFFEHPEGRTLRLRRG